MNAKNKKLILALVALVLAAALFAGIYAATRPAASAGSKAFSVEVVHKDESSKLFDYTSDAEFLGEFLLEEGLIQGDMGQYGLYITVVDGETADYAADSSYWAFYQNGEYASQGVDTTPITSGDRFSLVYTIG